MTTSGGPPASSGAGLTVRDARARYFVANGFDERGYADRWVRLQAGPIPLFIPNTRSRSPRSAH